MPSRLFVAIACVSIAGLLVSCSRDEDLAEAEYTVRSAGASARVWVPINEPRSIGTYRAELEWPDGGRDRVTGKRDGMITDVWLSDIEPDGTPELVVAMSSAGSGTYGSVHVCGRGHGELARVGLRALDDSQRSGYLGHDTFSLENGRLVRSFPRYEEGDSNATPSGQTLRLWYSFADSAWVEAEGDGSGGRAPDSAE